MDIESVSRLNSSSTDRIRVSAGLFHVILLLRDDDGDDGDGVGKMDVVSNIMSTWSIVAPPLVLDGDIDTVGCHQWSALGGILSCYHDTQIQ